MLKELIKIERFLRGFTYCLYEIISSNVIGSLDFIGRHKWLVARCFLVLILAFYLVKYYTRSPVRLYWAGVFSLEYPMSFRTGSRDTQENSVQILTSSVHIFHVNWNQAKDNRSFVIGINTTAPIIQDWGLKNSGRQGVHIECSYLRIDSTRRMVLKFNLSPNKEIGLAEYILFKDGYQMVLGQPGRIPIELAVFATGSDQNFFLSNKGSSTVAGQYREEPFKFTEGILSTEEYSEAVLVVHMKRIRDDPTLLPKHVELIPGGPTILLEGASFASISGYINSFSLGPLPPRKILILPDRLEEPAGRLFIDPGGEIEVKLSDSLSMTLLNASLSVRANLESPSDSKPWRTRRLPGGGSIFIDGKTSSVELNGKQLIPPLWDRTDSSRIIVNILWVLLPIFILSVIVTLFRLAKGQNKLR